MLDGYNKAKELMVSGTKCSKAAEEVLNMIDKRTINHGLFCAQLLAGFGAFAQAAVGFCAVNNTIFGDAAERHLANASQEIAEHLKSIAKDVGEMNNAAQANLNLNYQSVFAQHVHDFISMVVAREAASGVAHYVFLYHPGNEWHASFKRLTNDRPIKGFCGLTDNIILLLAWLPAFRDVVGPDAKISILMPSAHMYVVTDALTIDPSIGTLDLLGETHHSGAAYAWITVADNLHGLQPSDVGVIVEETADGPGVRHQVLKWTTTITAGLGAGIVGTAAGGGIGGGAAGTWAGIRVGQAWDRMAEEERKL